MKTLQDFLEDLGSRESSGNYKAINKYGYLGKYQMGEMALIDCGYYKKTKNYNNDWSGEFLGKDNVYSKKDFLNNPQAQENAIRIFMKRLWKYLKAFGAHKYVGEIINSYKITNSGILAGAHLKGAGSVIKYLSSDGKCISKDGFGTSIESYIKKFANYDVTEITN